MDKTYTQREKKKFNPRAILLKPPFKQLKQFFWIAMRFSLKLGGFLYVQEREGIIVKKNCDFMKDPEFMKAYTKGRNQAGYDDPVKDYWKYHINQWAAFHAKQLGGDFVECGTAKGCHAMSIVTYLDLASLKDRRFYLFDTFCGLNKELSSPEEYSQYKNAYPDCYQFVVDSFKDYPNVVPVRGSVPGTLEQVNIQKVAYLHIDMNCVKPEIAAIKYFWPKLQVGAIVILDDYGCLGLSNNQKKAMDGFAFSVGAKIASLPTGQGMMVKPPATGNA